MFKKNSSEAVSAQLFRAGLSMWLIVVHKWRAVQKQSVWQHVFSCLSALRGPAVLVPGVWQRARWNPVKYPCNHDIMTHSCMFVEHGYESDSNSQQQRCGQCCGHKVADWQCNVLVWLFSGKRCHTRSFTPIHLSVSEHNMISATGQTQISSGDTQKAIWGNCRSKKL